METDVIISGAGPVGMSLALALALKGVSVIVLEKLNEQRFIHWQKNLKVFEEE